MDDEFVACPLANQFTPRTLLVITAIFWTYITISNVLYAHGMRITVAQVTQANVFSPGLERVLQHIALYPALVGCYWTSLRIGWTGIYRILAQGLLSILFAASSYFAMDIAESIYTSFFMVQEVMATSHPPPKLISSALFATYFTTFLVTYGFGLALVTGFAFYRRYHQAELRVSALEREWGAARLSALRMQLSPHTLFNLLHTIRGQIAFDPEAAREMVVQLADLLRRLLGAGQREFSLLSEELRFVRLYLELQQQRFSDRLTIKLPDEAAQPAVWVPSLILQPLVENAVVHGLSGHDEAVEVRVEASISADILILRVTNTVATEAFIGRTGIGLSNVRERLRVQFGRRAALSVGLRDAQHWVAEVSIPLLSESTIEPAATAAP